MQQRGAGMPVYDAGVTAARLRFRAVMMTALSFLLGVVPLLIASGAGAASQKAIGVAVFGGMLAASTAGVILTPVLYVIVQPAREWASKRLGGTAPEPGPEDRARQELVQ
jgi:HAE1 family hydrophobic/amphiphilic exporter-1